MLCYRQQKGKSEGANRSYRCGFNSLPPRGKVAEAPTEAG